MKKIFVHIGGHKTGSTAIQEHLKINKKNLTSKGYFYYDTYESNTFSRTAKHNNKRDTNNIWSMGQQSIGK